MCVYEVGQSHKQARGKSHQRAETACNSLHRVCARMGVRVFVGCSFAAVAAVAGIEAERPRRHAIAGDGSVHESPKQLPSELLRILWLLQKLGLVINPARSVERAHSCSATTRDRSRVAVFFSSFAGLLPEESDPRTRQPCGERTQARGLICRCRLRWPVARVQRSSVASAPRGLESGHASYCISSHLLVRPRHLLVPACRTKSPSRAAAVKTGLLQGRPKGLVLTAASTMAA